MDPARPLSITLAAQLACVWETTARCPGNAHRFRDFSDVGYVDFLHGALVAAPVLEKAKTQGVGPTVLEGVRETRRLVGANTNLGVLLLLAPLAAAWDESPFRSGVVRVLNDSTVDDARAVYQAIRLANPAGLGRVEDQDVGDEPTRSLQEVMGLAAGRDLVARQYADGFHEVFEEGLPALHHGLRHAGNLENAIIYTHLCFLANHPDSLIARKRGTAEAEEAAERAGRVLQADWPLDEVGREALAELDAWLRANERGRNPGTTADLVTASLFAALREGIISLPLPYPWSFGPHHG